MGNKGMKNSIKVILVFLIGAVLFFIHFATDKPVKEIEVLNWDNYYNENNINFFYENSDNEKIKLLDSTYKINEILDKSDSELDKVLRSVDILNALVQYDDVADLDFRSGYDILKEQGNRKKISAKNMASLERDILISSGLVSRVGVYRKKDAANNSKLDYYVVEYWSTEKNKWIMIDFLDKGYFKEGENELSAIEVINSDINKVSYIGNSKEKDHKKYINKYLSSYSIEIDNTIKASKSNTFITYIKDKEALEIKFKNEFAPPTIFTEETMLFQKDPKDNFLGKDKKAYIILMKKSNLVEVTNANQGKKSNEEGISMVVGAFKDGKIMDKYYLDINNTGYEEINKYTTVDMKLGETKINLSLDGINSIGNIIVRKN